MNQARLFRAARPGDRKQYFRSPGLRGDATETPRALTKAEMRAHKLSCAESLVTLLGVPCMVKLIGQHLSIVYDSKHAPTVTERIQTLRAQQKLAICRAGNGAVNLAPNWARVLYGRLQIEVYAWDGDGS